MPRADAAVFLLDATQILTASERQFLEERILRSTRDRLIFVSPRPICSTRPSWTRRWRSRASTWRASCPSRRSSRSRRKRALAGDRDGSGLAALVAHLGATVGHERRKLLLDHALADAARLSAFVRQSLGMRRRSLELPLAELEERIGRAKEQLRTGKKALEMAAEHHRAPRPRR